MTQITEQAPFLVDSLANQDEARDLDSLRASSLLVHAYSGEFHDF